MKKLKDLLKESYVWERKFGEKLPTLASVQKKKLQEARKYKLGDKWSNDFDYEGMLEIGVKATYPKMSGDKLEKLASSFEDVNYHTVASPLLDAIDQLTHNKDVPEAKKMAGQFLKKFNKLCKDELKSDKLYGKFS